MDGAITLLNLYEKTSAAGRKYFVGSLNGNRILIMKDDRAEIREGGDPVWSMFIKPKDATKVQPRASHQPQSRREKPPSKLPPAEPLKFPPVRARARPAKEAKPSTARARAIADINAKYKSDLNDPVGEL